MIINGMSSSVDLWGTLLVTGLQLDHPTGHDPLFSHFSIHVTIFLSNAHINSFSVMISQETVSKGPTEVQADNIHYPPLIYQVNHFMSPMAPPWSALFSFGISLTNNYTVFVYSGAKLSMLQNSSAW
ncbi:hypothetical protein BTVI_50359 [Pitangus sulphuratus]|nr:hypothetical protein BTVI_50359 [Pitangus sulphuratus]